MSIKNEGAIGRGKSGEKRRSCPEISDLMGEGVGHVPRSDSGPISVIWPNSVHTCVACASVSWAKKVQTQRTHFLRIFGTGF